MRSKSAIVILGVGAILVVAWLVMLVSNAGRTPSRPSDTRLGRDAHYVLSDTEGHTVTERSFPGRLRLVFVGFTSCADVCPATLTKFRPALDALGPDAAGVQPLFVSVDPDRDTPERLARYVRAFDPRILGATGSEQQLKVFVHSYGVYVDVARHSAGANAYGVEHTSSLLLIGPNGELLDVVDSHEPPAAVAARLRRQLEKIRGSVS